MALDTRERRIDSKDFLYLVAPVCPAGHAEVSLDLGGADLADAIEKNGLQCPVCSAEATAEVAASVRQFAKWFQRVGAPGHPPLTFRVAEPAPSKGQAGVTV